MRILKLKTLLILVLVFVLAAQGASVFASSSSYKTLRFGSRGDAVSRLQQELIDQGFLNDKADGVFGPITKRAVIDFQKANNLIVDGIAGNQTLTALFGKKSTVSPSRSTATSNSSQDLYWLSRIIHAEAQGESYKGKVAVGNVILNRVKSKEFPNTIKSVIFDRYKNIPQFSPVDDGSLYNNPSKESIAAAKEALSGSRPVGDALYFFNPDKAAGSWIVRTRAYLTRIGGHTFYR